MEEIIGIEIDIEYKIQKPISIYCKLVNVLNKACYIIVTWQHLKHVMLLQRQQHNDCVLHYSRPPK